MDWHWLYALRARQKKRPRPKSSSRRLGAMRMLGHPLLGQLQLQLISIFRTRNRESHLSVHSSLVQISTKAVKFCGEHFMLQTTYREYSLDSELRIKP